MNWDRFFFRLTIVISAIPLFLGVLILITLDNDSGRMGLAVLFGLLPFGLLWILYYAIRWIVMGLKRDD